MSKIISMSEAASIAIHGVVLIARSPKVLNVHQIAEITGTSRHHVAKIMQRLVKEGFLGSHRGPTGGFRITKPLTDITLLQLYETIEGKIEVTSCPQDKEDCPFDQCIIDSITCRMTLEFRDFLHSRKVSDYVK